MTDLTTRATERREPGDASEVPDRSVPQPADPPPAVSGGAELTRLIRLARLTPAQALEIGAGVLAEAARATAPDDGSPAGDPVQVVVGADGRPVLLPAAERGPGGRSPAVGRAVEAVLADLAAAARRGARRGDPAAESLLTELDRAVTELPVTGVPDVARKLQEAAAAIDRGAVRAELAALVGAVDRQAHSTRGAAATGAPATGARAAPATHAPTPRSRTGMRRAGAWLLSVLVLAGVVVLEVAVLRDHIAADIGLLLDAGRTGSTSSTAPESEGLPIVPPAPAAAGRVAAVDLRPLAACAPGEPCSLRLLVRLVPGADRQAVTWSYRVVDRCTGATHTAPGGSVTVPAGEDRAAVVGVLGLPRLRAVAVVAVTGEPAAAASPPVFAGSCVVDQRAR